MTKYFFSELRDPPAVVIVSPSDPTHFHEAVPTTTDEMQNESANKISKQPNPAGTPTQRESIWSKLSTRIKNLERNVTLSGTYLEELSVRYKKQIEDLQIAVRKSSDALSEASKLTQQEKRNVIGLQNEVANLTERVGNLTTYMEAMSVGAVYVHAFFLVMEILVGFLFLFACCRRWRGPKSDPTMFPVSILQQSHQKVETIGGDWHFKEQKQELEADQETDISSTPSSSPSKHTKKRRYSLEEELFAIDEEEVGGHGEILQQQSMLVANGGPPNHIHRRKSMVTLSEPPPSTLSRKQRRRQQKKLQQNMNASHHHMVLQQNKNNVLLSEENRVQDIPHSAASSHQNTKDFSFTPMSSHYHTFHSPSKDDTSGQLPWTQVTRTGSVDNLANGTHETTPSNSIVGSGGGVNNYVQAEQNSRFVVQPVVNVYLNSKYAVHEPPPLTTSNKYGLLNNSLHDDPTPIKERSLNYEIGTSCEVVTAHVTNNDNAKLNHQKMTRFSSNSRPRKQLFSDVPCHQNGEDGKMSLSTDSSSGYGGWTMINGESKTWNKSKRSKSTSPTRMGQTAKQRVLLKSFNPDTAEWIQKQ